ncbi:hypothetical protein HHK36_005061 [Tetracentron sinense]|uniref:Uncharacterized protein n=1 Tax=Tetracentron sinense TaxID=13715 RepID=A0A834ZNN3_TETSI|nr:hypothetical protein HHK36_005061 [Tetracentron sinense]
MAIELEYHATPEALLENVWANFIAGTATDGGTGKTTELSQSWNELHRLDGRDGSMELLQRLPSLGRRISMGAESWEELLNGIIPINNLGPSGNLDSECSGASSASKPNLGRVEKIVAEAIRGTHSGQDLNCTSTSSQASNARKQNSFPCTFPGCRGTSSNPRKRASRKRNENAETIVIEPPAWKRLASIEEIPRNEFDVLVFQDLGSDYLESLLSSS